MKRWARNWDCCRVCKRADKPHRGRGLCRQCFDAERRPQQKAAWIARAAPPSPPKPPPKPFPEKGSRCRWSEMRTCFTVVSCVYELDGEPVVDTKAADGHVWPEMPLRILEALHG